MLSSGGQNNRRQANIELLILPQFISALDAARLLHEGAGVFIQGANGEPTELTSAIAEDKVAANGVHFTAVMLPGVNHTDPASLGENASATSFFITPETARSFEEGRTRFIPLSYSGVTRYFEDSDGFDFALIQVSPPDAGGICSLGSSVDFVPSILPKTKILIAEINQAMPFQPGSPAIPLSSIDYAVETDHPQAGFEEPHINEEQNTIGRLTAELIADGSTIETGIGKLPTMVLKTLGEKNDLGIHSGMISEPMADLIENGNVTGVRKNIDTGKVVAGVTLGSPRLHQFVAGRDDILFRPASYTHSPDILKQLDNFVAINSVISIDLFGQINGDTIDGRQVGGQGGLADFMKGAKLAKGGRSIAVLPASAAANTISKIVPKLDIVTCSRSDVDYVVTEHGLADIGYRNLDDRAAALIAIAAPEFRDELKENWKSLRSN